MTDPEYAHKDSRRLFLQILTKPVKQINYYEAKRGAVLGNHYHKKTTEYFFLLSGDAVISINGVEHLMRPLTIEVVRPMQIHSISCLSNIKFMTFLSFINGHKNLDIHKIDDTGLIKEERGREFLMAELDTPLHKKCVKRQRNNPKL